MTATATERQPLTAFIGNTVADPEETPSGKATKFRLAVSDGFGDDATTIFYDVVATKDPLREAIKAHVQKGTKLAILGTEKVDREYNPEKPQYTIFPVQISLAQNIKSIPVPGADEF